VVEIEPGGRNTDERRHISVEKVRMVVAGMAETYQFLLATLATRLTEDRQLSHRSFAGYAKDLPGFGAAQERRSLLGLSI
jgi:hypothetical protein